MVDNPKSLSEMLKSIVTGYDEIKNIHNQNILIEKNIFSVQVALENELKTSASYNEKTKLKLDDINEKLANAKVFFDEIEQNQAQVKALFTSINNLVIKEAALIKNVDAKITSYTELNAKNTELLAEINTIKEAMILATKTYKNDCDLALKELNESLVRANTLNESLANKQIELNNTLESIEAARTSCLQISNEIKEMRKRSQCLMSKAEELLSKVTLLEITLNEYIVKVQTLENNYNLAFSKNEELELKIKDNITTLDKISLALNGRSFDEVLTELKTTNTTLQTAIDTKTEIDTIKTNLEAILIEQETKLSNYCTKAELKNYGQIVFKNIKLTLGDTGDFKNLDELFKYASGILGPARMMIYLVSDVILEAPYYMYSNPYCEIHIRGTNPQLDKKFNFLVRWAFPWKQYSASGSIEDEFPAYLCPFSPIMIKGSAKIIFSECEFNADDSNNGEYLPSEPYSHSMFTVLGASSLIFNNCRFTGASEIASCVFVTDRSMLRVNNCSFSDFESSAIIGENNSFLNIRASYYYSSKAQNYSSGVIYICENTRALLKHLTFEGPLRDSFISQHSGSIATITGPINLPLDVKESNIDAHTVTYDGIFNKIGLERLPTPTFEDKIFERNIPGGKLVQIYNLKILFIECEIVPVLNGMVRITDISTAMFNSIVGPIRYTFSLPVNGIFTVFMGDAQFQINSPFGGSSSRIDYDRDLTVRIARDFNIQPSNLEMGALIPELKRKFQIVAIGY